MKSNINNPPSSESDIDQRALSEFMSSLQRLFKIGIYYPSGHVILDKATDRFMQQLAEIAANKKSVTLQVSRNTIILEDIELDIEQPFVKDLNILLSTLGIYAISIDKQISMTELHDFITKMLAFKSKAINAKQFTQVDVAGLPHSITIKKQEFLSRSDGAISGDADSADNLDSFIESLTNFGLDQDEIQQCRTLLDSLPRTLTKSNLDLGDLPYATWDDVASLLAQAIRGGGGIVKDGKLTMSSQENINALATILKKLELETHDQKSREAINLLVSIIKKPLPKPEKKNEIPIGMSRRSFPEIPSISIEKLQEFTNTQKINPKVLAKIPDSTTDTETLSILLQLARSEQTLPNQIRMQQFFRETLSSRFSERTWEILSCGLQTITADGNINRISSTVRLITEPLRRSSHGNTLHFFQLTLKQCDEKESRLLWPYIVNELLVEGSGKDKIIYHQLCQYAARLPHEHMVAALSQLKNLEAFQDFKIASDIFHAVSPSCYPLFAFFLKTEIERYVGERVLGGLRRNPRDWLIKAVAPLLDLSHEEHKLFLYSYLRQASKKTITEPLKKIAVKIITESIFDISQEKRNETWVENTIASMAQLPSAETTEMLNQISGGKKMLFIPDWPATCRKAAETALSSVKRKY